MSSAMLQSTAGFDVSSRMSEATKVRLVRWGTVALFVIGWEIMCRSAGVARDFLAPPSSVVVKGIPAVLSADAASLLWQTTFRFLIAFVVVAALGLLIGLTLGRVHQHVFLGTRDVITVMYALPLAPFYPLFVLWFGLGDKSEIAFGAIHGIIPVILLTMTASAGVPANMLSAATTMGATRRQRLLSVIVPSVVPEIMGALKIGAALSLLGVLLAELMISVNGVGTYITLQITNHKAPELDAMVLVVCVGAIIVNAVLSAIERRASRWRAAQL